MNIKQYKCKVCGAVFELDPDTNFCPECGHPVKTDRKVLRIILCIAAVMMSLVMLAVLLSIMTDGQKEKKQDRNDVDVFSMEHDTESETETETQIIESEIYADIDAVNRKINTVFGTIFYTKNMENPVLTLEESASVYVKSTAGEKILYHSVSDISLYSFPNSDDEMKRYNNVDVVAEGSLWVENDVIYMDVNRIFGEANEKETKEETEKQTEMKSTSSDDSYILPDSDKKYLTDADVAGLTLREINYAKNELYARHGRKFDSKELRQYFKSKSWYKAEISADDFSTDVFNKYEKANAQFLAEKEKKMGTYQLDQ